MKWVTLLAGRGPLQGSDRVTTAAGLQRLTRKTLRRTFATLAHYQTMVDVLTQAQLGHASPVQSMA